MGIPELKASNQEPRASAWGRPGGWAGSEFLWWLGVYLRSRSWVSPGLDVWVLGWAPNGLAGVRATFALLGRLWGLCFGTHGT